MEYSTYPSDSEEDFLPPCRFRKRMSTTVSANKVDDFFLNACPFYEFGFLNSKTFAISEAARLIVFTPKT